LFGSVCSDVAIQKRVRRLATSASIVGLAGMPSGNAASSTAPEPMMCRSTAWPMRPTVSISRWEDTVSTARLPAK
jgi:hypothetical protein